MTVRNCDGKKMKEPLDEEEASDLYSSPDKWKEMTIKHLGMEAPVGFPELVPPYQHGKKQTGDYL